MADALRADEARLRMTAEATTASCGGCDRHDMNAEQLVCDRSACPVRKAIQAMLDTLDGKRRPDVVRIEGLQLDVDVDRG